MNPNLWILSAICLGILAALLYLANTLLADYTGGMRRKLEDIDEDLAESLNAWYPLPDAWLITSRLVFTLTGVLFFFCIVRWQSAADIGNILRLWEILFVILLAAFFLLEYLIQAFSLTASAKLLRAYLPVLRILNGLFCWFSNSAVSLAALRRNRHNDDQQDEEPSAEDEILSIIEEQKSEKGLEDDERQMIAGAFSLDSKPVHTIMTPRVKIDGVSTEDSIIETRKVITESGHSRLPVYEDTIDHIVGILYAKDLLKEEAMAPTATVKSLMIAPLLIPETKNIGDLLADFRREKNHFAVALDEYGGTAGIVTIEDVLEEIVGDIKDEFDAEEEKETIETQRLEDGSTIVDARLSIEEVNDLLDMEIEENPAAYDTLGGYVTYIAGRIPAKGEELTTGLLQVNVLEADSRHLVKLKIRPITPPEEEEDRDDGKETP